MSTFAIRYIKQPYQILAICLYNPLPCFLQHKGINRIPINLHTLSPIPSAYIQLHHFNIRLSPINTTKECDRYDFSSVPTIPSYLLHFGCHCKLNTNSAFFRHTRHKRRTTSTVLHTCVRIHEPLDALPI